MQMGGGTGFYGWEKNHPYESIGAVNRAVTGFSALQVQSNRLPAVIHTQFFKKIADVVLDGIG